MQKWIRIGAMILSIIASVLLSTLPGASEAAQWASYIATFITALWNAWKNNDFTVAAQVGTEVMNAIKDGKITVEEVKKILTTTDQDDQKAASGHNQET